VTKIYSSSPHVGSVCFLPFKISQIDRFWPDMALFSAAILQNNCNSTMSSFGRSQKSTLLDAARRMFHSIKREPKLGHACFFSAFLTSNLPLIPPNDQNSLRALSCGCGCSLALEDLKFVDSEYGFIFCRKLLKRNTR
jgi:hypothetical protein